VQEMKNAWERWNLKILQAIRMADVKALTACRTLTLEARDFAELLRVISFFKTSNTHWSHFRVHSQSLCPVPNFTREPPFFQFFWF
jgi:hypothetical protein